jgi:hypothetical protein
MYSYQQLNSFKNQILAEWESYPYSAFSDDQHRYVNNFVTEWESTYHPEGYFDDPAELALVNDAMNLFVTNLQTWMEQGPSQPAPRKRKVAPTVRPSVGEDPGTGDEPGPREVVKTDPGKGKRAVEPGDEPGPGRGGEIIKGVVDPIFGAFGKGIVKGLDEPGVPGEGPPDGPIVQPGRPYQGPTGPLRPMPLGPGLPPPTPFAPVIEGPIVPAPLYGYGMGDLPTPYQWDEPIEPVGPTIIEPPPPQPKYGVLVEPVIEPDQPVPVEKRTARLAGWVGAILGLVFLAKGKF